MRKTMKERFAMHSLFFLVVMIVGINMLVFLFIALAEALLTGYVVPGLVLLGAILLGFFAPLAYLKRLNPKKRLKAIMKSDEFLMVFSLIFITIGSIVAAGAIWYFFYS